MELKQTDVEKAISDTRIKPTMSARLVPSAALLRALASASKPRAHPQRPLKPICPYSSQPLSLCRAITTAPTSKPTPIHPSTHPASTSNPQDPPPNPNASQTPDLSTPYTLFPVTLPLGPPPHGPFTIPLPALHREFLLLQSQYHPDKYPSSSKRAAEGLSARINEAYITLRDPLLRAQWVLREGWGVDVTSEARGDGGGGGTGAGEDGGVGVDGDAMGGATEDMETLAELMEVRERIEGCRDRGEWEGMKEENRRRMEGAVESVGRALEEGDVEGARREVVRLKYWRSLEEGLEDWEGGEGP